MLGKMELVNPISPIEIAQIFGKDPHLAENFLRTAVMVALVDGDYSIAEDRLIQQFCNALELKENVMLELKSRLDKIPQIADSEQSSILAPLKAWLDNLEVKDPKLARFLCKFIPSQCPFERDVLLFGRKVAHIPAMCQINPLYDYRSLCYLADDCGEDVSEYC
jgi:hypothetical protein